jgi:hypothetical protein
MGPFPSEEAFFGQVDGDINPQLMASFLTQELAVNHPELSVTFGAIECFVSAVKGAIQNLNLDPAIEEEAHRRREERDEHTQELHAAMAENAVDDGTDVEGDGEG